jgi:hypothetical protein
VTGATGNAASVNGDDYVLISGNGNDYTGCWYSSNTEWYIYNIDPVNGGVWMIRGNSGETTNIGPYYCADKHPNGTWQKNPQTTGNIPTVTYKL